MKKTLTCVLALAATVSCFSACGKGNEKESGNKDKAYEYDFTIEADDGEFKLLQLSDTQVIDSTIGRGPETWPNGYPTWAPQNKQEILYKYMDYAVEQNDPDLIVLIGDNVYADFDPEYEHLEEFIEKMDSYGVPWTLVFGNHDLYPGGSWFAQTGKSYADYVEGVLQRYEASEYCLFKRANVSENRYNEYTIGVKQNGEYALSLYMLDTGDESRGKLGITQAQCDWVSDVSYEIEKSYGKIPAYMYMHVALSTFDDALTEKYPEWWTGAILGQTLEAKDGDFGLCKSVSAADPRNLNAEMFEIAKEANVTNMYAGHAHSSSFSILYEGVRLTMGMKTGKYDSYPAESFLGSTLTTFKDGVSTVEHKPYSAKEE